MSAFNPKYDIPDLDGKVCLITGGSSGLGEAAIAALALHGPAKIYLAARSRSKAEAAVARIRAASAAAASAKIEILDLDLASLDSIQAAAARVNSEVDRLDLLQLVGGIAMTPHNTTKDGYEQQFAVNYMGHALLTQCLMPKLLATAKLAGADVRIVSMTSVMHKRFSLSPGFDFGTLKTSMEGYSGTQLYGQSMHAKTLLAHELAKRYPHITTSSANPGGVKTGIWAGEKAVNWFLYNLVVRPFVALAGVSPEEGAKTQLWCSFSKDVESGCYYEPVGKAAQEGKLTRDEDLSSRLWEWTEKQLHAHGAPGWPAS